MKKHLKSKGGKIKGPAGGPAGVVHEMEESDHAMPRHTKVTRTSKDGAKKRMGY